jgi:hypothetical protein
MRAHGQFRGREGSMPAGVDRPCAQHGRGRVVAELYGAGRGTGEVWRNSCGEGDRVPARGGLGEEVNVVFVFGHHFYRRMRGMSTSASSRSLAASVVVHDRALVVEGHKYQRNFKKIADSCIVF